tara:strand:- start:670 stop:1242 length:573 start_codon:yes stop_codon:yes gene_type:complete
MSNYFSHFPKTVFDIQKTGQPDEVVDILRRFIIKLIIDKKATEIYEYDIQEGDRPDIIAAKYYGSSKYDWIVMLANNIYDVNYDWPLNYQNFRKFIISKYGSIATAQQTVHHYEQIIRQEGWNSSGNHLPEITVEVDLTTYNSLVATDRKSITTYNYEDDLNEKKRTIKIIDNTYIDKIIQEAKTIYEDV